MELRSHVGLRESDWRKRLFEWLKIRNNNTAISKSDGCCQLQELLDKAQELQDYYLMQNPEAERRELNAAWLYNWNLDYDIMIKATKKLPQDVKMEDVILYYVVFSFNDMSGGTVEQSVNSLLSAKRFKRSSRRLLDDVPPKTRKNFERTTSRNSKTENLATDEIISSNCGHQLQTSATSDELIAAKKRVGKKLISSDLDRELWDWYAECKSRGKKLTVDIVRARARFVFGNAGHKAFKASEGWYRKWMRRWKVLQNKVDSSAINPPSLTKETIIADRPAPDPPENLNTGLNNLHCLDHVMIECGATNNPAQSSLVQKTHLGIMGCSLHHHQQPVRHPMMASKDVDIPVVETSSTGLDFMDVDFSLTSRSSDQVTSCLASNFASCLDATEISGLTLPSVGEDSAGVIMSSLNLTSSDALDLPEFMSVERDLRNSLPSTANDVIVSRPARRRNIKTGSGRYHEDFKREVVNYAVSKNSFKKASLQYGVHHATVSQWCRDKQMSEEAGNKILAANSHRTEAPDQRFIAWIRECRTTGVELDAQRVRAKAEELLIASSCCTADESNIKSTCRWFSLWMKRWTDVAYEEGMENELANDDRDVGQLIHYPAAFKAEVSTFAELRCNSWAARVFNVSRKRVADWISSKDRQKLKAGRKVASSDTEKQIWEWYLGRRAVGRKPNGNEMREKASQIFAASGISNIKCSSGWLKCFCNRFGVKLRNTNDDNLVEWVLEQFDQNLTVTHTDLQIHGVSVVSKENPNFKASAGWSIRFCRRHPKLLGEVATVDTPLPAQLEDRVNGFRLWIRNVLQQNGLMLAAIGCMDEVPLSFGASSMSADDHRRSKPLMRRTGLENAAAVVCLTILADGGVLPPLVLLKGPQQDIPRQDIPHDKQHVVFMDDLKVTEKVLQKWMDEIWLRHVPSPALLVFDGFEPHLGLRSRVMSAASSFGGGHDVAIIPGSCSSKLQPLDVHLRTAFLDCVNDAYVRWKNRMSAAGSVIKSTNSPCAADILNFVTAGHRLVCQKQEIVRRSFVVTGITTASDGSQDHLVDDAAWAIADT